MSQEKTPSIRSPLGKARGLGSAKDGTHHFIMQRISAFAIIVPVVYFAFHKAELFTLDRDALLDFLQQPFNAFALLLFICAAFYHAALGVQVIIEDYVHCSIAKPMLLALNKIGFAIVGGAAVFANLYICIHG